MRAAVATALALLASCYGPTVQAGLPCSELGACPAGQLCDRGVCVTTPRPDDASADLDAATDAGVDAATLIDAPSGVLAWIEATALPSARSLMCLATFNGRLYATGGSFQTVPKVDVLIAPILPNGLLGAWTAAPDLPMATRWHGCAVDPTNPSLYVVGGDNGTTGRDVVYRAAIDVTSGALGAWVLQAPLPAGRRGLGVVWAGGQLYAIGGEEADNFMVRDTVFQAATGATGLTTGWTTTAGLFPADYAFGTALAGGGIYLTGGYQGNAGVRGSTIGAGGALGAFTSTTALPGPRERHVSVSDGTYVYAIGGEPNFGGANLDSAYRAPITATGSLGAWSALPVLPLKLAYSSAVFASGRIYIAGGSEGTVQTARVFMLQGL